MQLSKGSVLSVTVSFACCNSVCLSLTLPVSLSVCASPHSCSSSVNHSPSVFLPSCICLCCAFCLSALTPSSFPALSSISMRLNCLGRETEARGLSPGFPLPFTEPASQECCGSCSRGWPTAKRGRSPSGGIGPKSTSKSLGRGARRVLNEPWRAGLVRQSPQAQSGFAVSCPGAPGPRRAGRCCCGCWRCCGHREWVRRAAAPLHTPSSMSATRRLVSPEA